jgi:hypothetical protein
MNHIPTKEITDKWGISELRVQKPCKDNCINVELELRFSREWIICKDAVKPQGSHRKGKVW